MKNKLLFLFLLVALISGVTAINFENITVPDLNTGKFTRYWYQDNEVFDGFGFSYSLIAPFLSILGPWFFAIIWSAMIYRSYEKTGTITMPIVLGILTGTVWGVVLPEQSIALWSNLFGVGLAAIVIKYLVERP